jgi:biotin carboxyl carrier protein
VETGPAVRFAATLDDAVEMIEVVGGDGRFRVTIGEHGWDVDARLSPPGSWSLLIDGASYLATVADEEGAFVVEVLEETYWTRVEEATRHAVRTRGAAAGGGGEHIVKAPMPGQVTHVAVRPGDVVAAGDPLLVIEAMKMQNEFKARAGGTVTDVRVSAGQAVNPGDILLIIK